MIRWWYPLCWWIYCHVGHLSIFGFSYPIRFCFPFPGHSWHSLSLVQKGIQMSAPRSRGLVWALLKIDDPLRIGPLNPGGGGAHVSALLCPRKRVCNRDSIYICFGKMSRYNSEKNRKQGTEFANHFWYIDCIIINLSHGTFWRIQIWTSKNWDIWDDGWVITNAKALMKKCTNYKLQAPSGTICEIHISENNGKNPTRFSLIKHHETATSSIEEVFLPWPPIFCHTQIVWPVAVDKKWHSHVFSGSTLSRDT